MLAVSNLEPIHDCCRRTYKAALLSCNQHAVVSWCLNTVTSPLLMWDQKKCHFTRKHFVWYVIFWLFASSKAPLLSSKTQAWLYAGLELRGKLQNVSQFNQESANWQQCPHAVAECRILSLKSRKGYFSLQLGVQIKGQVPSMMM